MTHQLPSPVVLKSIIPRPVPWWIEVTAKLDPMIAPLLRDSRALMAEGDTKLTVEAANPMALRMMDKPEIKDALLNDARRYADVTELVIRLAERKPDRPSQLDDFEETQ